MLKHRADLLKSDTRKPVNKVRDVCPILEILEESSHRDTSTAKNPRATHTLRITLNGWARGPINHAVIVDLARSRFNSIIRTEIEVTF